MKFEINITNTENIQNLSKEQVAVYQEIMVALISSGGLSGVKGGQTIIHFDPKGNFMGVQLNYWPWKRLREQDRT